MQNVPKIPTIAETTKFPYSSTIVFQWGLILFLIGFTFTTGLSKSERADFEKRYSDLNNRFIKVLDDRVKSYENTESLKAANKQLLDSLQIINKKLGGTLLPSAKRILKNGK